MRHRGLNERTRHETESACLFGSLMLDFYGCLEQVFHLPGQRTVIVRALNFSGQVGRQQVILLPIREPIGDAHLPTHCHEFSVS